MKVELTQDLKLYDCNGQLIHAAKTWECTATMLACAMDSIAELKRAGDAMANIVDKSSDPERNVILHKWDRACERPLRDETNNYAKTIEETGNSICWRCGGTLIGMPLACGKCGRNPCDHDFKQDDRVRYHPIIGGKDDGNTYTVKYVRADGYVHLSGKCGMVHPQALSHPSPNPMRFLARDIRELADALNIKVSKETASIAMGRTP